MSKRKKRSTFEWIVETAIYLYLMYAGIWCICKLMGGILRGLGVG